MCFVDTRIYTRNNASIQMIDNPLIAIVSHNKSILSKMLIT